MRTILFRCASARLIAAVLTAGLLIAAGTPAQTPTAPGPEASSGSAQPAPQSPATKDAGPQDAGPQDSAPTIKQSTADALRSLATQLTEKQAQRTEALGQNDQQRVQTLDGEIQELRWQFAGLMTQIDVQQFEAPESAQLDLLTELLEALRPIVGALKDVTDGVRKKHDLEQAISDGEERLAISRQALQRVDETLTALRELEASAATSAAIEQATIERSRHWVPRISRLEHQLLVARENLQQLKDAEGSWWSSLQDKRGAIGNGVLSILISLLVFVAVLFSLRALFGLLTGKRRKQTFRGRLTEIVVGAVTMTAAIAATLVVPYSREEYVLLTLGIVIVIGTCWVLAKSAPTYIEQIRLFLNIGSVREGERILVDGLPYRVESLRFYSKLRNPELTGGTLRIPIGQLIGERSRAAGSDEPWFPCKQGDIVAVDGMIGRIALQTPEVVTFVERNDAPRSIPTAAFVALNPRNLSAGFEVGATFGIDYSHQADSVVAIPKIFRDEIFAYYEDDPDRKHLVEVRVEFASANSSSLDYRVQVEFRGEAAPRYDMLNRKVHQALVTACTKHGYGIPFPQLTVHGVK